MWQQVCATCGWAGAGVFWRDAAAERQLAQSTVLVCPVCEGTAFNLAEVAEWSGTARRSVEHQLADRGARLDKAATA